VVAALVPCELTAAEVGRDGGAVVVVPGVVVDAPKYLSVLMPAEEGVTVTAGLKGDDISELIFPPE
jgi:hypothetical protein